MSIFPQAWIQAFARERGIPFLDGVSLPRTGEPESPLPWCINTGKSLIPLTLLFFAQKRNLLIPLELSRVMHQGTILVEPGDTLIFPQGSVKVMLADAAAEAGKTKTINVELKWTFTEGADSAPPGVSTAAAG